MKQKAAYTRAITHAGNRPESRRAGIPQTLEKWKLETGTSKDRKTRPAGKPVPQGTETDWKAGPTQTSRSHTDKLVPQNRSRVRRADQSYSPQPPKTYWKAGPTTQSQSHKQDEHHSPNRVQTLYRGSVCWAARAKVISANGRPWVWQCWYSSAM